MPAVAGATADDPASRLFADAFAALPLKERYQIVAFLDFWRELPREDRAVFVKSVKQDLSEAEVARLVGVTPRQLLRYGEYQRLRDKLMAEYREPKRRHWYRDDESAA